MKSSSRSDRNFSGYGFAAQATLPGCDVHMALHFAWTNCSQHAGH